MTGMKEKNCGPGDVEGVVKTWILCSKVMPQYILMRTGTTRRKASLIFNIVGGSAQVSGACVVTRPMTLTAFQKKSFNARIRLSQHRN